MPVTVHHLGDPLLRFLAVHTTSLSSASLLRRLHVLLMWEMDSQVRVTSASRMACFCWALCRIRGSSLALLMRCFPSSSISWKVVWLSGTCREVCFLRRNAEFLYSYNLM